MSDKVERAVAGKCPYIINNNLCELTKNWTREFDSEGNPLENYEYSFCSPSVCDMSDVQMKTGKGVDKPRVEDKVDKKETYIECDCGSEILRVTFDEEMNEVDLAIYQFHEPLSFWNKLRYIWQVLVKGKPYRDQICISADKAHHLAEQLLSHLKENKIVAEFTYSASGNTVDLKEGDAVAFNGSSIAPLDSGKTNKIVGILEGDNTLLGLTCAVCDGSGKSPLTQEMCKSCDGKGYIEMGLK